MDAGGGASWQEAGGAATGEGDGFSMDVHVSRFFNDFDPLWEFRGFVSEGKVTALTAYNPVRTPLAAHRIARASKRHCMRCVG